MENPSPVFARFRSGIQSERGQCFLARWLFLRLLGVIYLIAFVSLWTQIDGLIGRNGILPAGDYLKAIREQLGPERYWWVPTFCWISPSDGFLHFQCAAGVLLSLLLIAGVAPVLDLVLLWAIYLSLSMVCREFLGFQWDILLLETGFLAIFFAPRQWLPGFSRETPPPLTLLWLFRWLLFRLMFMSGAVKLVSADATWRNLTALTVHYETQPLPTWIGWYAHQLPAWFHKTSCGIMFVIELAAPFLIFFGRRARQIACAAFAVLMLLISLTGNYCFFNLLTVALCVLLLDDKFLSRLFSRRIFARSPRTALPTKFRPVRVAGVGGFAAIILLVSVVETAARLFRAQNLPWPLPEISQFFSPLRTVNSYGLFAVMTTTRPEIVVEGSNDGVAWLAYEFRWKPGDLKRSPAFVAPHQPRLDWQMWFAALGDYRSNPWFANFLVRLLRGSPDVLALLGKDPFPGHPPRYIRAMLYEYHFTDFAKRSATGEWWRRESKGLYCPEITLRQN
jgi:hypothetical protein